MSCFVKSNVELTMKLTVGDRVVTSSFRVEAPGFHTRDCFCAGSSGGRVGAPFRLPKSAHPPTP